MNNNTIRNCADALYNAQRHKAPIPPLTQAYPAMTADEAYAVQLENVNRLVSRGELITGKKIGLTSPGIQQQLGVNEPDYGHLFQSMACAYDVPASGLLQPRIEAEIAFVLGEDILGGNITAEDVRKATAYVVAAFEIVDSRITDWEIRLPDTIADNASAALYVLGETRLPIDKLDLASVTMQTFKAGEGLICEGSGAAVMGDPVLSVAWLANALNRYGVTLKKGEVILSGAFCAAPPAQRGDVFSATFSQLGTVEARFV